MRALVTLLLVLGLFLIPFGIVGYLEARWDGPWQAQVLGDRVRQLRVDSAQRADSCDSLSRRLGRQDDSLRAWVRAYEAMRRQRDILAGMPPELQRRERRR